MIRFNLQVWINGKFNFVDDDDGELSKHIHANIAQCKNMYRSYQIKLQNESEKGVIEIRFLGHFIKQLVDNLD